MMILEREPNILKVLTDYLIIGYMCDYILINASKILGEIMRGLKVLRSQGQGQG